MLGTHAVGATAADVSTAGRWTVFRTGRTIRGVWSKTGLVYKLAVAASAPVGLSIEGTRVVWAENGRRGSRVLALTLVR